MKKILLILLCLPQVSCVTMHRHPVIMGVVIGGAAGVTAGLLTRHTCPHMINGYYYDGTPPCPNPATYDPGPKRK